jgi:hypothetical protein
MSDDPRVSSAVAEAAARRRMAHAQRSHAGLEALLLVLALALLALAGFSILYAPLGRLLEHARAALAAAGL